MKTKNLRIILRILPLTLAFSSFATHAETFNLGLMLKESVKKALLNNSDSAKNAVGSNVTYPTSGSYEANDQNFERSLTIHPNGTFELEVMEKGQSGNLRSGSGNGQLVFNDGQWQYTEGSCSMTLAATPSALQLHVKSCASRFGDVPFDGRYQLKIQKNASTQVISTTKKNKQLAAQLNCQNLNFSDNGIGDLLGKVTRLPQNEIWNHEIVAPSGYTFGDLQIQSLNLSDVDGGFLALFVEGDAVAIKSAIKKVRVKGDTTMVMLRKVGEANGYPFPGKRTGQLYVQCQSKPTQYGMY